MMDIESKIKSLGVKDYEIFHEKTESLSMETKKCNFQKKEYKFREGYGLRVIKDGRVGFSFFTNEDGLEKAVKTAVKTAGYRPKTDFSFQSKSPKIKVKPWDKKVIDLSEERMKELIKGMLENITENKTEPISCEIGKAVSDIEIINSEGLHIHERETILGGSSYCSFKGKSGDKVFSSYKLKERNIVKGGKIASKRAKQSSKAKHIAPSKLPVILDYDTAISIIGGLLLPSMTGEKHYHKSSYLIGKEGKRIASPKLTIIENPCADASSISNFDGEGTGSKKRMLIRNGVFTGFVYDRETAALEGIDKDGYCSRGGYSSKPGIGFSNIEVSPGKVKNLENVHKDYIVIGEVFGLHTANKITGDFGLTIGRGYKVENGKKEFILGNTLSGNVYEMIKHIKAIEAKQKIKGSFIVPRIKVEGLRIV